MDSNEDIRDLLEIISDSLDTITLLLFVNCVVNIIYIFLSH
jgi:hypothetical protein